MDEDSRRKVEVQTSPECEWSASHMQAVFVVPLPESCLEVVCVRISCMYWWTDTHTVMRPLERA